MGFFHITRLSRYNLQYEEDIIKGIRVERNKWKLATINVSIEENETILKELGVDFAQGHLIGKPAAIDTILASLDDLTQSSSG